jgi:hypothetical protein
MSGLTSAQIDFGLTTSYGMTAPVDLTQASYRTLLLGMKPSSTYNFRVTATGASGSCQSQNYTIMTGAKPNGLTEPCPAGTGCTPMMKATLTGGFVITGQYTMNAGSTGAPAYILDADGKYVWWYTTSPPSDVTGVRMDYAGTHMWINSANVKPNASGGRTEDAHVHRVTMDGMTDEDLTSQFTGMNHQLTILPDETVAFYAYNDTMKCEDIKERAPNGTVKTLINAKTAHAGTCHVNDIQYSPMDNTLVFSDLENNCITKITRAGAVVWVLNGVGAPGITSSFTGDTWLGGQHGIHILGLDDFLIFNNNSTRPGGLTTTAPGSNDGSIAIEMKLDQTAKKATKAWTYKAMGSAYQTDVMGDLQRLPNGNTIIAYSTKGVIREVNSSGTLLQEWTAGKLGDQYGYIEVRPTLYGPPPK